MEDSTIAILTRLDTVNDRVTDLSTSIGNIHEHRTRLERVESKLNEIGEDIEHIKNGPIYNLDRFITKKVAQTTGGVSIFVFLAYVIFKNILNI
tara:strand:+ start:1610 stop:1891 length:282 start_codon:yes stop_codon:yes gene_type:complete